VGDSTNTNWQENKVECDMISYVQTMAVFVCI